MCSVQANQLSACVVSAAGTHPSLHTNKVVGDFIAELKTCLAFYIIHFINIYILTKEKKMNRKEIMSS